MSLLCKDCGSNNIVESVSFTCWFSEGTINRNRIVNVEHAVDNGHYEARCSELDNGIIGHGETELDAILDLGKELTIQLHITMLGTSIGD